MSGRPPSIQNIDPSSAASAQDVTYRFGEFELSTRPLGLRRRSADGTGEPIAMQPQPARALELLAERNGGLVTREELRERLWGLDTHLDHEQAINFTIRKVRAALDDSAQNPRYVETLPRQGYRLVVPVERLASEDPPLASPSSQSSTAEEPRRARRVRSWRFVALALVAIVVGVAWAIERPQPSSDATLKSPVQNESLWRVRVLIDRADAPSLAEAREVLEELLTEDPDSPAVAMAMADWAKADGARVPPRGKHFDAYWPEVERWADRARTLDPSLVDAHVLAANARFYLRNDRADARRILEEEVLPRRGDHPRGLHVYGLVLASHGEHDRAISTIRRAVALAPENLYVESDLALAYLLARRFDEAIAQARRSLELGSSESWWLLLEAQDLAGQAEQAEATAVEIGRQIFGAEIEGLERLRRLSYEAFEHLIPEGDPRHPAFARWAVQVGEDDVAIDALVAACAGPGDWDRPFLGVHPRFEALREHPRWAELTECVEISGHFSGG